MILTDLKWSIAPHPISYGKITDYLNVDLDSDGLNATEIFERLEKIEETDNFFITLPESVWYGKDPSEYFDALFVSKNIDREWSIQTRMNGQYYINWWRENSGIYSPIISRGFIPKYFSSKDFAELFLRFIREFSLEGFK